MIYKDYTAKIKSLQDRLDHLKIDGKEIIHMLSKVRNVKVVDKAYVKFDVITVSLGVKKHYDLYMDRKTFYKCESFPALKIVPASFNLDKVYVVVLDLEAESKYLF